MSRGELVRALRCGDVATLERFFRAPQVLEAAVRAESWLAALTPDAFQRAWFDDTQRGALAQQLARVMYGNAFDPGLRLFRAGVRPRVSNCRYIWFVACDGSLELSSFASSEAACATAGWLLSSSLVQSTPLTVQWMVSVLGYYGSQREDVGLLELLFESSVFRDLYSEDSRMALLDHICGSWIRACCSITRMRRNPKVAVAELLLAHGTHLETLQRAVVIQHPSVNQFLVDNGVLLLGLDQLYCHCRSWFCIRPQYLQVMVNQGADPRNVDGRHTWHRVISSGSIQAVQVLLDRWCVDVDARQIGGHTPLMVAAIANRTYAIRKLLDMGADIAATDSVGRSALALAASNSSLEAVELLLTRGADPNQTDREGDSVLQMATRRWRLHRNELVDVLLRYGAR